MEFPSKSNFLCVFSVFQSCCQVLESLTPRHASQCAIIWLVYYPALFMGKISFLSKKNSCWFWFAATTAYASVHAENATEWHNYEYNRAKRNFYNPYPPRPIGRVIVDRLINAFFCVECFYSISVLYALSFETVNALLRLFYIFASTCFYPLSILIVSLFECFFVGK